MASKCDGLMVRFERNHPTVGKCVYGVWTEVGKDYAILSLCHTPEQAMALASAIECPGATQPTDAIADNVMESVNGANR